MHRPLSLAGALAVAGVFVLGLTDAGFAQGLNNNQTGQPGQSWVGPAASNGNGGKIANGWDLDLSGDWTENYGNQGEGVGEGNAGGSRPNQ
jgi:hypothetical protein